MKQKLILAVFGGFLLAQAVEFALSHGFGRESSFFAGDGFNVLETRTLGQKVPEVSKKVTLGHCAISQSNDHNFQSGLQLLAMKKNKPDAETVEHNQENIPAQQEMVAQQEVVVQLAPVAQEPVPVSTHQPAPMPQPAPMMQAMQQPMTMMPCPMMQHMMQQQPVMQQPIYQPMIYNQQPQIAMIAMQMQSQAMAMQSQASALMMQAAQQPMMQQSQSLMPGFDLQKQTKSEKMQKLTSYLQQIAQSGPNDIERLLSLLDSELDIITTMLANSGGQIVDRLVMERNQFLNQSSSLTRAAYDLAIDIATAAEQDGSDSRLYQYFVRKSKKTSQSVPVPQGRKKFLLKTLSVLQEEYEMIEKMQRIVSQSR